MPLQASLLKSLLCQRCCRSLSLVGKLPSICCIVKAKLLAAAAPAWSDCCGGGGGAWTASGLRVEGQSWSTAVMGLWKGRCVALRTRAT